MKADETKACETLSKVLAAVRTNKCWVYELHNSEPDAPDFKASLLRYVCVRARHDITL